MVVKPGKTRVIVTVDADVVEDVRKLLEEIGLSREYLSTLINDSLKAQRVALGQLAAVKRRRQHTQLGAGEFTSLLFDVLGGLKALDTEEEATHPGRAPHGAEGASAQPTDPARPAEGTRGAPQRKRGPRRRPPASRKTSG
jgi:hypothetical protein